MEKITATVLLDDGTGADLFPIEFTADLSQDSIDCDCCSSENGYTFTSVRIDFEPLLYCLECLVDAPDVEKIVIN